MHFNQQENLWYDLLVDAAQEHPEKEASVVEIEFEEKTRRTPHQRPFFAWVSCCHGRSSWGCRGALPAEGKGRHLAVDLKSRWWLEQVFHGKNLSDDASARRLAPARRCGPLSGSTCPERPHRMRPLCCSSGTSWSSML